MSVQVINRSLFLIFEGIRQLQEEFPKKNFTLDGRIVGDIGEVIAERDYELALPNKQIKTHDAVSFDGRLVQIKATFKDSIGLRFLPDNLLVFKLFADGKYEEIYNGPGIYIKEKFGHRKGFDEKQLTISINALKKIQPEISLDKKIVCKNKINIVTVKPKETVIEKTNDISLAAQHYHKKKDQYSQLDKETLIQLELKKIESRVPNWSRQYNHKAHQVMKAYCKLKKYKDNISVSELTSHCNHLPNPRTYISHMSDITPNNYAKVFEIQNNIIEIWNPAKDILSKYYEL